MENPEKLIGRKIKGFKFENNQILNYSKEMDIYIGEDGIVEKIYKDGTVKIRFENDYFFYPADQIEANLVEDEIPTLSDGVMMLVSDGKINWYDKNVKFIYNGRYYTFEDSNLTFVPWIHCKPIVKEPTKEEQLTAILGSSEKVSEIMELFKK